MKKKDLAGQRFGKLTVLSEGEPVKYVRYWLCQCDCGNKTRVAQGNLLKGASTSCGCNRKQNGHVIDLTGQVFGQLTVKKFVGTKNRYATWECLCSCGNIKLVQSRELLYNRTKSCGCLKRENAKMLEEKAKKYIVDGVKTQLLTKKMKRSKTGVKGVHEIVSAKGQVKYRATIGINRKRYVLGTFDELEDAIKARKKGEEIYHRPYLEKYSKQNVSDNQENKYQT